MWPFDYFSGTSGTSASPQVEAEENNVKVKEAELKSAKSALEAAKKSDLSPPVQGQPARAPVVGGRRRRKTASKKSSGKRKTAKKSMFNIKWPKL
jgi:ssDNA-binding replication factor A large subunit